jgi:acyl dehydratase
MSTHGPAAHDVIAANIAATSENKIHDDAIARRLGYRGALVPGVAVYAYMAHMPVARWGRAWLERGMAECKFRKPVYDGARVRVTAAADGDTLALAAESEGVECATGFASIASGRRAVPDIAPMPERLPPAQRPKASETSLAAGLWLGITPLTIDGTMLSAYLDAVNETDPLYRAEGLIHPGQILQLANRALLENVVLGPWIHLHSKIRHHAAAHVGERLTLRAKIAANAMVKGHATVEFDAVVIADGKTPIAEINHQAIWQPRQLVEDSGPE